MAGGTYDIGDVVRLRATFTVNATATDPTTITLKVKDPSNVTTTYTYSGGDLTKEATGIYRYDYAITASGTFYIRWEGTGTAQTASEDSFTVRQSAF